MTCSWCDYTYKIFNQEIERGHLSNCPVYQNLPIIEIKNNKKFVKHPKYNLLVELITAN